MRNLKAIFTFECEKHRALLLNSKNTGTHHVFLQDVDWWILSGKIGIPVRMQTMKAVGPSTHHSE